MADTKFTGYVGIQFGGNYQQYFANESQDDLERTNGQGSPDMSGATIEGSISLQAEFPDMPWGSSLFGRLSATIGHDWLTETGSQELKDAIPLEQGYSALMLGGRATLMMGLAGNAFGIGITVAASRSAFSAGPTDNGLQAKIDQLIKDGELPPEALGGALPGFPGTEVDENGKVTKDGTKGIPVDDMPGAVTPADYLWKRSVGLTFAYNPLNGGYENPLWIEITPSIGQRGFGYNTTSRTATFNASGTFGEVTVGVQVPMTWKKLPPPPPPGDPLDLELCQLAVWLKENTPAIKAKLGKPDIIALKAVALDVPVLDTAPPARVGQWVRKVAIGALVPKPGSTTGETELVLLTAQADITGGKIKELPIPQLLTKDKLKGWMDKNETISQIVTVSVGSRPIAMIDKRDVTWVRGQPEKSKIDYAEAQIEARLAAGTPIDTAFMVDLLDDLMSKKDIEYLFTEYQAVVAGAKAKEASGVKTTYELTGYSSRDYSKKLKRKIDNPANTTYNLDLSARRADVGQLFLLAFGVNEDQITTKAGGFGRADAPGNTDPFGKQNQRTDLTVTEHHPAGGPTRTVVDLTDPIKWDQVIGYFQITDKKAADHKVDISKISQIDNTGARSGVKADYIDDTTNVPDPVFTVAPKIGDPDTCAVSPSGPAAATTPAFKTFAEVEKAKTDLGTEYQTPKAEFDDLIAMSSVAAFNPDETETDRLLTKAKALKATLGGVMLKYAKMKEKVDDKTNYPDSVFNTAIFIGNGEENRTKTAGELQAKIDEITGIVVDNTGSLSVLITKLEAKKTAYELARRPVAPPPAPTVVVRRRTPPDVRRRRPVPGATTDPGARPAAVTPTPGRPAPVTGGEAPRRRRSVMPGSHE